MENKIDFVIPWVDGSDPAWQAEKKKYKTEYGDCRHNGVTRYRDMGLMRYWFRSVEQNAPWVRKIHFITWGHLPPWLNTEHPKLHIVNHKDYIPGKFLPTFNANVIEINLHRIEELSEYFVYFNDDMFLTRQVREEDFFIRGLPCDEIKRSEHLFTTGQNSFFAHLPFNNMCVVNRHFTGRDKRYFRGHWLSLKYPLKVNIDNLIDATPVGRGRYYQRFHDFHTLIPLLKHVLCEVWEKEEALLSETSSHKVRTPLDVTVWLFRYFQLARGTFVPKDMARFGKCFTLGRNNSALYEALRNRSYATICINDAASNEKEFDFDRVMRNLKAIFNNLYPMPSKYENDAEHVKTCDK